VDRIQHVVKENAQFLHEKNFEEWSKYWSGQELVVMLDRMGISNDKVEKLKVSKYKVNLFNTVTAHM
jgi:hypothetical protein